MKKKLLPLLILLLIALVTHWRWFFNYSILTYGDWGFFFTEKMKEFLSFPFLWSRLGFGAVDFGLSMYPAYLLYGFLSKFTDFAVSERIVYLFPSILLATAGSYFLLKKYCKSDFGPFVGSLVYTYNTYFIIGRTGHLTLMSAFAFAPLFFLFFANGLERKSYRDAVISGMLAFISCFFEIRAFYLIAWIAFFYFLFFLVFVEKKRTFRSFLNNCFLAAVPMLIAGFANLYWVLGLLRAGSSEMGNILSRGLFGNSFLNVLEALTLFHPFWTGSSPAAFVVQPIPWYFWLIPLFSILGLVLQRKNKQIAFFGFISLLGIILTKQVGIPFPSIYPWFFENLPGFNAFREASKFYFFIALGYSVLISSFVDWLWLNWNVKNWQVFLKYFLTLIVSLIFLKNAKPLMTGEIRTLFVPRYPHNDYLIFKDYILKQPGYFLTFWSPTNSRFSFLSSQHPLLSNILSRSSEWKDFFSLLTHSFAEGLTEIFKKSYSDQRFDNSSIKYIVVPIQDIANDDDFFVNYGAERNFYIDELDKVSFLKKIDIGTKELTVYENEGYYPHFYTSQYQVFSTWKLETLLKFYDLKSGLRTSLYASGINPVTQNLNERKEFKEAFEGMDEIIIETNLENLAKDEELGNYRAPAPSKLPDVFFKPGTFLSSLDAKIDDFNLNRLNSKPKLQFEKYLSLANKRIAECLKFNLLDSKQLEGYKKEILDAARILESLKLSGDKDFLKLLFKLKAYLNWHSGQLNKLKLSGSAEEIVEDLFRELNGEVNKLKPTHQFDQLIYKFYIPKEGSYEIYQREKGVQIRDMGYEIEDNRGLATESGEIKDTRYEIEDKRNSATGSAINIQNTKDKNGDTGYEIRDKSELATEEGKLKMNSNRPELLKIGNIGWKLLDKKYFKEGENELVFDNPDLGENLLDDNLKIREYFSDTVYKVSFRYKASDYGTLVVNEGKEGVLFTLSLPKTRENFQGYETFFKSSPFAEKAFLNLTVDELEGLRVERVRQEEIILRMNADNADGADNADKARITRNPTITFGYINPTKYKIRVEGAKDPFTLIFSEGFHKGWKLYSADNTENIADNTDKADNTDGNRKLETGNKLSASGRIAETGKLGNDEIVETYFDGEVKEKKAGNGFDKNIYETWGKKPIADNRHLIVNGFANSWHILPEDVNNKENYELIVEFEPQRYLYIGLGISLMTLISCLGFLAYDCLKTKRALKEVSD